MSETEQIQPATAPVPSPVVEEAPPTDETPVEAKGHGEAPASEASLEPAAAEAPASEAPGAPSAPEAPAETPAAPASETPAAPARPQRQRRRRPTAAERHRRVFFARLSEMRNGPKTGQSEEPAAEEAAVETAAAEEPVAEAPVAEAAPVEEPAAEAPAEVDGTAEAPVEVEEPPAEQPVAEEAPADDPAPQETPVAEATSAVVEAPAERTARDQARLVAAIERVGGVDVIRQALQPKRDDNGKPLKWAAVCCEASQGLKPGDPTFQAWVRLAATPVREIKTKVPDDRPQRGGGRRGGPRRDDRGAGGPQSFGGGPGRGPRRDRDDRGRASREDFQAAKAYGGRVGAKIVIPGFELGDDDAADAE